LKKTFWLFLVILLSLLLGLPASNGQLSVVGALQVSGRPWSAVIDSQGLFAYVALDKRGGESSIAKIRLADLTTVAAVLHVLVPSCVPNCGTGILYAALIDEDRGFAYFGTDTNPGAIARVRLFDLSQAGMLVLGQDEGGIRTAVMDGNGEFAYFGININPGKVVKVRLSDFVEVATITLDIGPVQASVIDSGNGFAYFSDNTRIARVRLSDFSETGSIEGGGVTGVIDTNNGFAYFALERTSKIRLSDFTRVASVELGYTVPSGVIDSVAGYAYFGAIGTYRDSGGIILRVRLSDMVIVEKSELPAPYSDFWSAVMDTPSKFAYFNAGGGYVVKISTAAPPPELQTITTRPTFTSYPQVTTETPQTATSSSGQSTLGVGVTGPMPLSSITVVVIVSVIAFPFLIISVVAYSRHPRSRARRAPLPPRNPWGCVVTLTAGGMLLVASLWQLEIVEIAASMGRRWCPPFNLGGCLEWYIARDYWFTGVFAAFVLASIGIWRYAGHQRSRHIPASDFHEKTRPQPSSEVTAIDERLFSYITQHGGTISLSEASNHFRVSVDDIKSSIERLKKAGRIA